MRYVRVGLSELPCKTKYGMDVPLLSELIA